MDAPGELFPTLTAVAESRVALKRAQTAVIVVYLGIFPDGIPGERVGNSVEEQGVRRHRGSMRKALSFK
jgi:hypothetical protein